jgi:hypothetical protein
MITHVEGEAFMTVDTRSQPNPDTTAASAGFEPDDRWVPVDRRWLGFDRATIVPALIVAAVAVLMAGVLPAIERAVPYDDVAASGDVLELDGRITFVPSPGWGITSGVRTDDRPVSGTYPDSATVIDGDLSLTVRSGPFDGDADALFTQIGQISTAMHGGHGLHVTGDPEPIVTDTGQRGLIAGYSGTHTDGVLAAFVFDDRGVEIVAVGPADASVTGNTEVLHMITSIAHTAGGES